MPVILTWLRITHATHMVHHRYSLHVNNNEAKKIENEEKAQSQSILLEIINKF